ncbi:Cobalamin synthase [Desulfamplus magnetovallimortis]|uniref:Adenosylcobinamide-GDP ribazoletransferase n=2 Tax=Desulfamplus magnetovallimortis TaxID=1246637 RepID=A0A1W1HH38_9BACT|nr:Cobalamin synthase [Desulfamplus magnetovallimortis]
MFITILPAGKGGEFSPTGMIRFFPVVGLILGFIVLCADLIASIFWQTPVVALIDVLVLVALTGAFHIDGLGDAADGLFSHRSRERALEIMKDSRIGMMGLVAVFWSFAIKIAGIYSLKDLCSGLDVALLLLVIPAYSRAGMLFGIRYFKYGRESTGTGHDLFEKRLPLAHFIWISVPIFLSLFLGFRGIILNICFVLCVSLILFFYSRKMGCITGDMLGAMTEVTESVMFLAAGMAI